jgi:hypothetical protein
MAGIFISYRREDTGESWAHSVAGVLAEEFGGHRVFFDIASIAKGKDFRTEIETYIKNADVVLVIIGPDFFAVNRANGERRIDETEDPVRMEIRTALIEGKPLIPVLTDRMALNPDDFPEDIRQLAYREKAELRTENDLNGLVGFVAGYVRGGSGAYQLSTGQTILRSKLDRHLVDIKARTAVTEQLIKMGWLLDDDRYGDGALGHPEFPGFRFRFERESKLLVLEATSDAAAKKRKWKPVAVFYLSGSILDGTGYITLPVQIRLAATNPKKVFLENGFMSRWRYRNVLKERLPLPLPSPAKQVRAATDQRIKAHDARHRASPHFTIEECQRISPQAGPVPAVAFHPQVNLLAVGTSTGEIQLLWGLAKTGLESITFEGHEAPVQCMAFASDGRLASGSSDGVIKIWDVAHANELHEFRRVGAFHRLFKRWEDSISSISWSPDGVLLASSSWEKAVWIWNTRSQERPKPIRHETAFMGSTIVAFHPDGETLIASGLKSLVRYDVSKGATAEEWPHDGKVNALVFSPDGGILAVAGGQGTIHLYDSTNGDRITALLGHEPASAASIANDVWGVAFSPDSRWLSSIANDNRVILWDLQNHQISNILSWESDLHLGPSGPQVVWSPDGKLMALPTKGGEVHILAIEER